MTAALTRLGVHRIPVPVPFPEAGGPANVYVIEEQGAESPSSTPASERRMAAPRCTPASTSWRSRWGRAAHLRQPTARRSLRLRPRAQEASGAPVHAHVRDHDKLTGRDRTHKRAELYAAYLTRLGAPPTCSITSGSTGRMRSGWRGPRAGRTSSGRSVLRFKRFSAECSTCQAYAGAGVPLGAHPRVLFSDDHLLERVSPNPLLDLEGQAEPTHKALLSYLESREGAGLAGRGDRAGHAEPFSGHAVIIDRLLVFYGSASRGSSSCSSRVLARRPSWRRCVPARARAPALPDALGSVGNLEVLEAQGRVARSEREGCIRFEAV